MEELIDVAYFGTFQMFQVTFCNLSVYVGLLFASLYAYYAYNHGAPADRYSRDRSIVAQVPLFLLLDVIYPWAMTLITFLWTPTGKTTAEDLWKRVSALWIFTAIGWLFRGTLFDVYFIFHSWWRGPPAKPADSTAAAVVDAATPAAHALHTEISQLALNRFLAVFNVILILVTFPLTFPSSKPFIQLLEKLFGQFMHPHDDH
jgi:hypothetical protein